MQSRSRASVGIGMALATGVTITGLFGGALGVGQGGARLALAQPGPRLEQIGHHDLGGNGQNGDVWLHRGVAYVGSEEEEDPRGCPGVGVRIVSLADPTQPALLGTLADHPGTTAEQMRVQNIETVAYSGDLLAVGLQRCGPGGLGGLELWSVTNPRTPELLSYLEVVPAATAPGGGVHELDLIQRADGRVLALLAVPYSESSHPEHLGDFRVVDVTDPRAPRQLAAWGAEANLGLGVEDGQGFEPIVYAHSVYASPDGRRAYVSYWDAGVLIFDLDDPAVPRLLGRTSYARGEEGNAHSVDLLKGGRVLVEADEVFDVTVRAIRVDGPPAVAGAIPAGGTLPAPPWPETPSVSGELVALGRGCPAGDWTADLGRESRLEAEDPYSADPTGRIVLLDRGICPFAAKLDRASAAGAVGAVIVNTADGTLVPRATSGALGAFGISRTDGDRLKAELQAGRTVQVTLSGDLRGYQDFGGLRFWDIADPTRPRQIGTFRTARARVDPAVGPPAAGQFTVHNPVVRGDLLFASWYSEGVRVLNIADPTNPREVAYWIPTAPDLPNVVLSTYGPSPLIWGVAVEGDLVVASDINAGLYVLRLAR